MGFVSDEKKTADYENFRNFFAVAVICAIVFGKLFNNIVGM